MNLHNNKNVFNDLINIVAQKKNIPASAVERDYYLVQALLFLSKSDYCNYCVFKGGTSLSKCFPRSIERFSEDIDLTYINIEGKSEKEIERNLKSIEQIMTVNSETEKINNERNGRNKSIVFWHGDKNNQIKLEIGSSVRPEPYSKKTIKTYIQEYLEELGYIDDIKQFELVPVELYVLNIERTFIDKVMAVKRHSMCGNIISKSRHIYDVKRLYEMKEIHEFLSNKDELKRIIRLTKETDSYYLSKRNIPKEYNPLGKFDFDQWYKDFIKAKSSYEKLHETLLYTSQKQNFDEAIEVFKNINNLFNEIGE